MVWAFGVWERGGIAGRFGMVSGQIWDRWENALCWVFKVIERGCVLYPDAVNSLHMLDEEPNLQIRY